MALSDIKVRNTKAKSTQQKLFDGGGLFLLIRPSGSKLWRLKYRLDGVEKLISLGTYPSRSLKAARAAREAAKALLASGVDPSHKRQADRASRTTCRASGGPWRPLQRSL